jgi:uncharacterized protein (DUF1800 family)
VIEFGGDDGVVTPLDDRAVVGRLLDRFGFGAAPGERDAAVAHGFDATLAGLLDSGVADPGSDATPPPDLGPAPVPPAKQDKVAAQQFAAALRQQESVLLGWWLDRMVAARVPVRERLTWFWHGHFATSEQKVRDPGLMLRQNETFRTLGPGSFTALAQALAVDPAMLVWLDGQQNKAGSANENLAREFMELFTLGVGHYSEADVREAARALTGWTVDKQSASARPVARRHDNGTKTILGSTADFDNRSFVDLVLARPESPRFVVGRLWFRLVSPAPPAADTVDRLVAAYGAGRDISAVLRAIAAEPAFRDSATTLVKQPVEWLAGLLRALGLRPSTLPAQSHTQLVNGLRGMGQLPFLPPSVGGWPAGPAWLTTSAGVSRLALAQLIAQHADLQRLSGVSAAARPDAVAGVLGVGAWTPRTKSALSTVEDDPKQLLAVAACAPEYVVST